MGQLVPILEFIHELRSAGAQATYWGVLDDPEAYWKRLSSDRRALFLTRLGVDAKPDANVDLRVVRRRGRAPVHENVFVRIEVEPKNDVKQSLVRARDYLLFEAFDVPEPEEDAAMEGFNVPQSVFREVSWNTGGKRPIIDILDEAWDSEPYSVAHSGGFTHFEPIPNFEEVERYWVEEPFALVVVLRDDENELVYHIEEPQLTEMEKAFLVTLNERLRDVLTLDDADTDDRDAHLVNKVFELLRVYRFRVDRRTAYKLAYYFVRNYLGSGRLEPVMRDAAIEDVSCNGPHIPLYVVHSKHQNVKTNLVFDELELNSFTIKLAQRGGKLLSVAQPLVDATLPDGSRIQASLGREITSRGSAFTIRKFRADPLTAVDLIRSGTHSLDTMAFLWLLVEMQRSLVVMGATASGKTTTLNCLSQFIPPTEKVVTIEDTREMMLQHENWLAAVTRESFTGAEEERITMYDLLRAALRQRPDYVIVGEIRGVEGLTLFQAMSTGHTCFSTMHAGNVENAVYRLENPPISVPRVMLTSLDFFLVQGQVDIGGRPARRMLSLTEVNGIDPSSRNLRMNEIFKWDASGDAFANVTQSHVIDQERVKRGWTRARLKEELIARREVLAGLVERNERHFTDVARAVRRYYDRRDDTGHDGAGAGERGDGDDTKAQVPVRESA